MKFHKVLMPSFSDSRPDPDQLLEQLRGDYERARRGKLRIYFGASAGVGKTFAMLSAAQRERKAGGDIVVGVIETHGRSDTAELVAGLELLPLKNIAYRSHILKEFDLDGALARKPAVLLVDELAHSNVDGSRHATPSAGKMCRSCLMPALMSGRRSMCSILKV